MSKQVLENFYRCFQSFDHQGMATCYHPEVRFTDPVFTDLDHRKVTAMWEMLIMKSKGELDIDFHSISGDEHQATCVWEAKYYFSKTGNHVHNIIRSEMVFQDGLIIQHTDRFDFWRWSKMALGLTGTLLGWSPVLKKRVRKVADISLQKFLEKR